MYINTHMCQVSKYNIHLCIMVIYVQAYTCTCKYGYRHLYISPHKQIYIHTGACSASGTTHSLLSSMRSAGRSRHPLPATANSVNLFWSWVESSPSQDVSVNVDVCAAGYNVDSFSH